VLLVVQSFDRMKILLTGANGFIGRYLFAGLVAAGHDVVPAVRRPSETDQLLPRPQSIHVDFNRDVTPEVWIARLDKIDAVINCAGILQARPGQSIKAIHTTTPEAMFKACEVAGIRRVIQISAISVGADTEYARTKRAADDALMASCLDWTILRPSLVYAGGAYGGTALFRALAALPIFIPIIGDGEQRFQPIHVDDLTAIVVAALALPNLRRRVLEAVGPDQIPLQHILVDLRRWLGLPKARLLKLPLPLIRAVARIGDLVGGPVNTTALCQLEFGNCGTLGDVASATGVRPRRWHDALRAAPAQPQDRWQARLYFLRPALRWTIATTWIVSGLIGLMESPALVHKYSAIGITLSPSMVWSTCLLDVVIGLAVFARRQTAVMTWVQLGVVILYTAALTVAQPSLWLDPLGPLLKNVTFMMAVMVLSVLENER